jgi:hypothetical protein
LSARRVPDPIRLALAPVRMLAFSAVLAFCGTAQAQEEYCPSGTVECADGCMPAGAVCCGYQGYCAAGETCASNGCLGAAGDTPDVPSDSGSPSFTCSSGYACADGSGCCPNGTVCGTGSNGCDYQSCCETGGTEPAGSAECPSGFEVCADRCMPLGAVCCGYEGYCDAGETCTDGGCASGGDLAPGTECSAGLYACEGGGCCPSGSVCGTGANGCDYDSCCEQGSVDDTPGECLDGYVECAGRCMPAGAVCCGEAGYCDAGEFCTDTGCLSEDGGDQGSCSSGSYSCADGSGCCAEGTLCGTGANGCAYDSCCLPSDPTDDSGSVPLVSVSQQSQPGQPTSDQPTAGEPTFTTEGGYTCAGEFSTACEATFCVNIDIDQAYYASGGVRFDCESTSELAGCAQRLVDYCTLVNRPESSPASTPAPAPTESPYDSYEDEDDDICSFTPPRRNSSAGLWALLAPVAWLALRRRAR